MRILQSFLLVAATAALSQAAVVNLSFSSQTVELNQTFTVSVAVTDVFGAPADPLTDVLVAFGADYAIDPAAIEFVSAEVDPLFTDDSALFGGNRIAGSAPFPGLDSTLTEPLALFTLTFRAIGYGSTSVGIASDLGDPNQGLIFSRFPGPPDSVQADLTQSGLINVVPEPSTLLLLAFPLALATFRRR